MGNFIILLVAYLLGDGLAYRVLNVRRLAFDHAKGNAIYKEYDIRPAGLVTAGPLDGKLFRDMKDVVLGMFPVDVVQGKTLDIAVH